MIANFIIYPSDSNLENVSRAREYLRKLHPLHQTLHVGPLVIELFGADLDNKGLPLVFGSSFREGKLFDESTGDGLIALKKYKQEEINDGKNVDNAGTGNKGNYVILFPGENKLNIEIDPLRQYHIFSSPSLGMLSSSFIAACHFNAKLSINKLAFYEKMLRGYNIAPDTIFNEVLHVHSKAHLNSQYYSIIDNAYAFKDDVHYRNRKEALDTQVDVLNNYMTQLKPLVEKLGGDLGLSSGYDSRLLLSLLVSNKVDNYQLHTHGIKGVALHNFEQGLTSQLARTVGKNLKVVPVEPFNRLTGTTLDEAITNNFQYFQGRNSHNMGALTQTYALPYKTEVMGENKISLNGLGGEIFRNYYYLPQNGIDFRLFAQNHLFYRFSNWLVSEKLFDDVLAFVQEKMEKRIDARISEKVNINLVRRYYSQVRMPDGDGCNHNAHNKHFHFITPFIDPGVYDTGLSLAPFIGTGGDFEGEIIQRLSNDLASLPTHYGSNAINPGLKSKINRFLKVHMGQKIQRKRFDYIASKMPTNNEGGVFLKHLRKESGYFNNAWENLTRNFPEINWKYINLEFPCLANAGMISLTLFEFRDKINSPSIPNHLQA